MEHASIDAFSMAPHLQQLIRETTQGHWIKQLPGRIIVFVLFSNDFSGVFRIISWLNLVFFVCFLYQGFSFR